MNHFATAIKANETHRALMKELRKLQLNATAYAVLLELHNSPNQKMTTLSQAVGVTTASITGTVDMLEHKGLAIRFPTLDRRVQLVALTERGEIVMEDLAAITHPTTIPTAA